MSDGKAEARGFLALVAGAICIGLAPIWVRASEVGAVATAFYRLALSLPILWLWAAHERAPTDTRFSARDAGWALATGAFFALDLAAWHLSIRWTSVANATLLANLAPLFVALGAWVFLGERAGRIFWVGFGLALVGAWQLTGASLASDPSRLRGDVLGLVTAVFYGGYQLCVARMRRQARPGRVLLWSSWTCTPLLGLIAAALGEDLWPDTPRGWAILAGLALTSHILGQGLITYGFAHLPASHSSLTLLLQPLVAAGAAWWLLQEPMNWRQAAGGGVLLAGILVARRQRVSAGAPPRAG